MCNHRKFHDNLMECSTHIECAVPGPDKKIEHLIDSINCTDSTLQAAMSLVRDNTNNMPEDFEASHSSLIEVDLHRQSNRSTGRNANVSTFDLKNQELTYDDILKINSTNSLKRKSKNSCVE